MGTRKEEKYNMARCFALCIGMLLFQRRRNAQLEELAKRAGPWQCQRMERFEGPRG